jgi:hypothetical protein
MNIFFRTDNAQLQKRAKVDNEEACMIVLRQWKDQKVCLKPKL